MTVATTAPPGWRRCDQVLIIFVFVFINIFSNVALIFFSKAGEEWTTIAKTKNKKKTKPEDEWQEVNSNCCPNYWCPSYPYVERLGARRKIAGGRSQRRPHLTPINNQRHLSKDKVVKEVAGDEVEGMEAVVEVGEIGVAAAEEEATRVAVALFPGRTPEAVGGLHLELHEVEEA